MKRLSEGLSEVVSDEIPITPEVGVARQITSSDLGYEIICSVCLVLGILTFSTVVVSTLGTTLIFSTIGSFVSSEESETLLFP